MRLPTGRFIRQRQKQFDKQVRHMIIYINKMNEIDRKQLFFVRGYSSDGRALEWHSRGRGFESHYLHYKKPLSLLGNQQIQGLFCVPKSLCAGGLGSTNSLMSGNCRQSVPELHKNGTD